MKKKNYLILFISCLLISSCGSSESVQEVVSIQEVQEEITEQEETTTEELTTDTENLFVEEDEISTESAEESEELSDEEKELFWEEYKGDVREGVLRLTLNDNKELGEASMDGPVEVPEAVTKEYERRIEEGFIYEPEKVYNYYSAFSDAEIIEMVNERYLELHNEKRRELGLCELKLDDKLNSVATIRAEEASYFFNHTRPNGEYFDVLIPWNEIEEQVMGENISCQFQNEASILKNPRSIVYPGKPLYLEMADAGFKALCNSPKHYYNISLDKFKYIGIDSYIVRNKYGDIIIITAFEFCTGAMY